MLKKMKIGRFEALMLVIIFISTSAMFVSFIRLTNIYAIGLVVALGVIISMAARIKGSDIKLGSYLISVITISVVWLPLIWLRIPMWLTEFLSWWALLPLGILVGGTYYLLSKAHKMLVTIIICGSLIFATFFVCFGWLVTHPF